MGECHCGLGSERQLFVGVFIWSIYNGAFDQLRLATMTFKHSCRTLFTPAKIPMKGFGPVQRLFLKKPCKIRADSCLRTPRVVLNSWLAGLMSGQPHTSRSIRAQTKAPRHMAQGSLVT